MTLKEIEEKSFNNLLSAAHFEYIYIERWDWVTGQYLEVARFAAFLKFDAWQLWRGMVEKNHTNDEYDIGAAFKDGSKKVFNPVC